MRAHARWVGALFLLAYVFYGGGTMFATKGGYALAFALILSNSVAVASIGLLARSWVAGYSLSLAKGYMYARLAEALLLAGGGLVLWLRDGSPSGFALNYDAYTTAMILLALGSLGFCWGLWKAAVVPAWLALWGLVGYAIFGAGMIAQARDMESLGYILMVPGALFEVVFGLWLMIRGEGKTPATPTE